MNTMRPYIMGQQPLIDVAGLTNEERAELLVLWREYDEYVHRFCQNLFSFQDFINHTTGKSYPTVSPLESEYVETQDNTKKAH